MRKAYKALSVLAIVLMLVCTCTPVFAASTSASAAQGTVDVYGQLNAKASGVSVSGIAAIGNKILTVITTVGMVLSVVIVAILGIKYMMGSTEEKAEYKKTMIPYLVGAVLVFGASVIGKTVYEFTQQSIS